MLQLSQYANIQHEKWNMYFGKADQRVKSYFCLELACVDEEFGHCGQFSKKVYPPPVVYLWEVILKKRKVSHCTAISFLPGLLENIL